MPVTTIINSLLDTDLYKFTMMQAVYHQFNRDRPITRFKFQNRNPDINLCNFIDEINAELDHLCSLRFTDDEIDYLNNSPHMYFLSSDFIDYLRRFSLRRDYIRVFISDVGELSIECEGPWVEVILFEVPVLAIVQEVYTRNNFPDVSMEIARDRLHSKLALAKQYGSQMPFNFADFGTRRRFSGDWQREVVETFSKSLDQRIFVGTSNVLFAKEFGLTPIGTMAHEWLQAGQALTRVGDSQRYMLEKWVQEYRGDLGIALSDVVGFDAFLRDFDKYFAKLYDGARHDSGDPFAWGEKLIEHYHSLNIPAQDKIAVFSDGLDIELAGKLAERFRGRIRTSFGIGTNLTNDLGVRPLQIVMKMVECNGNPVAKISDSSGKGMCESPSYLTYLKKQYRIEG